MKKISSLTSTATSDGLFTNGSVATGVSPTILDAGWFNTVQNELVAVVQGAGLTLDDNNDAQVLAAITALLGAQNGGRLLNTQIFASSGTYTPTAGTKKIFVEVLGAGGGGGGVCATASGYLAIGAGGGAGGNCYGWVLNPVATAVTVGVGGDGGLGTTSANGGGLTGSIGGTSSFAALIAYGGKGGAGSGTSTVANGTTTLKAGADGGASTGGDVNNKGNYSPLAIATTTGNSISGYGASSIYGGGGIAGYGSASSAGGDATAKGAGGSGGYSTQSPSTPYSGGKGGNGLVKIWEFA